MSVHKESQALSSSLGDVKRSEESVRTSIDGSIDEVRCLCLSSCLLAAHMVAGVREFQFEIF